MRQWYNQGSGIESGTSTLSSKKVSGEQKSSSSRKNSSNIHLFSSIRSCYFPQQFPNPDRIGAGQFPRSYANATQETAVRLLSLETWNSCVTNQLVTTGPFSYLIVPSMLKGADSLYKIHSRAKYSIAWLLITGLTGYCISKSVYTAVFEHTRSVPTVSAIVPRNLTLPRGEHVVQRPTENHIVVNGDEKGDHDHTGSNTSWQSTKRKKYEEKMQKKSINLDEKNNWKSVIINIGLSFVRPIKERGIYNIHNHNYLRRTYAC